MSVKYCYRIDSLCSTWNIAVVLDQSFPVWCACLVLVFCQFLFGWGSDQ